MLYWWFVFQLVDCCLTGWLVIDWLTNGLTSLCTCHSTLPPPPDQVEGPATVRSDQVWSADPAGRSASRTPSAAQAASREITIDADITHIYICKHACTHVCTHTHMHAHTHTQLLTVSSTGWKWRINKGGTHLTEDWLTDPKSKHQSMFLTKYHTRHQDLFSFLSQDIEMENPNSVCNISRYPHATHITFLPWVDKSTLVFTSLWSMIQ